MKTKLGATVVIAVTLVAPAMAQWEKGRWELAVPTGSGGLNSSFYTPGLSGVESGGRFAGGGGYFVANRLSIGADVEIGAGFSVLRLDSQHSRFDEIGFSLGKSLSPWVRGYLPVKRTALSVSAGMGIAVLKTFQARQTHDAGPQPLNTHHSSFRVAWHVNAAVGWIVPLNPELAFQTTLNYRLYANSSPGLSHGYEHAWTLLPAFRLFFGKETSGKTHLFRYYLSGTALLTVKTAPYGAGRYENAWELVLAPRFGMHVAPKTMIIAAVELTHSNSERPFYRFAYFHGAGTNFGVGLKGRRYFASVGAASFFAFAGINASFDPQRMFARTFQFALTPSAGAGASLFLGQRFVIEPVLALSQNFVFTNTQGNLHYHPPTPNIPFLEFGLGYGYFFGK